MPQLDNLYAFTADGTHRLRQLPHYKEVLTVSPVAKLKNVTERDDVVRRNVENKFFSPIDIDNPEELKILLDFLTNVWTSEQYPVEIRIIVFNKFLNMGTIKVPLSRHLATMHEGQPFEPFTFNVEIEDVELDYEDDGTQDVEKDIRVLLFTRSPQG